MSDSQFSNLLAMDTSSKRLVLALGFGGDRLVQSDNVVDKSHGVSIMKKIDELFESAALKLTDLDGIVVCLGPGSFTGLRIGIAVTKGLAVATGLPVVGVSLFELFSHKLAHLKNRAHLVLPSRRGEWYLGTMTDGVIPRESIQVVNEARLRDVVEDDVVYSSGFDIREQLPGIRTEASGARFDYTGGDLVYLGRERFLAGVTFALSDLEPMYLARAIAEKRFEERHGTG